MSQQLLSQYFPEVNIVNGISIALNYYFSIKRIYNFAPIYNTQIKNDMSPFAILMNIYEQDWY